MCGISGFWQLNNDFSEENFNSIVSKMSNSLSHRGPNDTGSWIDINSGVAFGHKRLSIVDLTAAGHQPMISSDGRYVITFNGEIYNHILLRNELKNYIFQNKLNDVNWVGHSDTETLLACFSILGVEKTLKASVGMFAFALWDRIAKSLTIVRDRMGEKPLYFGWIGKGQNCSFVFGSELKSIESFPGFSNPISRIALAEYLRFMYVPTPLSIYENIYKLQPGCSITITSSQFNSDFDYDNLEIKNYWCLEEVIQNGKQNLYKNESKALIELEDRINESINTQSIADVPLGAFLSGGIDSSTVVALMQAQTKQKIKTFTIGFDEMGFDEAPYAREVAKHIGTDHFEMRFSESMIKQIIPTIPFFYDEPFADSSQIPTLGICKAASELVTVALTGDAGDELFGGYNRYLLGNRVWNKLKWMPFTLRKSIGSSIQKISIEKWNKLSNLAGIAQLGDKAHKLAFRLESIQNMEDLYWSLVTEFKNPEKLINGINNTSKLCAENNSYFNNLSKLFSVNIEKLNLNSVEAMMYCDSKTYLSDDILCKVDRASMSCSLETRVPFLDFRLIELSWRLPQDMKIRKNQSKWAIRQILYKYVPKELIDRPKAGFGVPIGQWLRGSLRKWAEELIEESKLKEQGFFDSLYVNKLWVEHQSFKRDHTNKLWAVLMFQAWLTSKLD